MDAHADSYVSAAGECAGWIVARSKDQSERLRHFITGQNTARRVLQKKLGIIAFSVALTATVGGCKPDYMNSNHVSVRYSYCAGYLHTASRIQAEKVQALAGKPKGSYSQEQPDMGEMIKYGLMITLANKSEGRPKDNKDDEEAAKAGQDDANYDLNKIGDRSSGYEKVAKCTTMLN